MFETTTVTLPLNDFDTLRDGERAHKDIATRLSRCFDYTYTKNPEPKECDGCNTETDCDDCEVYQNNSYETEKLTVDVERLIRVAKQYALYGKDVETDLDAIPLERKSE